MELFSQCYLLSTLPFPLMHRTLGHQTFFPLILLPILPDSLTYHLSYHTPNPNH
jgi:hypothetical protein